MLVDYFALFFISGFSKSGEIIVMDIWMLFPFAHSKSMCAMVKEIHGCFNTFNDTCIPVDGFNYELDNPINVNDPCA